MVMASATGLSFLVTTFSRPLVPLLAQELGAGAARVGAVVAAYAVIPLVLAVPAGALVDRLGSRRLFVAGACGIVLGLGAIGLKPSIPVLFGAQALAGLSELLVIVAGQTYATSLSTGREREQHLGWYTTMVSAGQLVGPLLGGVLADAVGYARSFLTASVLGLLPVLVGTRVRDLPWASRQEPEKGATSLTMEREALGRILRTGGVQLAVVTSFATLFTMGVRQGFYPIYVEGLGYSAGFVGAMLSLRALASMSVRPFMPRIVRLMRGRFPTVFASMLVSALAILITPWTRDPVSLAVASVAAGIGLGLVQPLSMLAVAETVPQSERGLALGVRLTGNRLAQGTSPVLYGLVAEVAGIEAAFVAGGLLLLAATGSLLLWRDTFAHLDRPQGQVRG